MKTIQAATYAFTPRELVLIGEALHLLLSTKYKPGKNMTHLEWVKLNTMRKIFLGEI